MTHYLTATVIRNPTGKPGLNTAIEAKDFIEVLLQIGVETAITSTAGQADMETRHTVKGKTYTFTIRPYMAKKNEPEFWLEAMLQDDNAAEITVAFARVKFDAGEAAGDAKKAAADLLTRTRRQGTAGATDEGEQA